MKILTMARPREPGTERGWLLRPTLLFGLVNIEVNIVADLFMQRNKKCSFKEKIFAPWEKGAAQSSQVFYQEGLTGSFPNHGTRDILERCSGLRWPSPRNPGPRTFVPGRGLNNYPEGQERKPDPQD